MNRTRGILLIAITNLLCASFATSENDEDTVYKGKFIGQLNAYHDQVSGNVYAADEFTLLLTSFSYDGNGTDTFFWAGSSYRSGPEGFIVPNEWGKTNVLERCSDKEFTLTLPDNKKISDITWFAVYDLSRQITLGDVYIPDEFDPPSPQIIDGLKKRSHGVTSGSFIIIDEKTIRILGLEYDGLGTDTYFWVGQGQQPSSKGTKVPDEYGYLDRLRKYNREDVVIELPGEITIFNIDWLSIFDVATNSNYGSAVIPKDINVPPSLVKVRKHEQILSNCVQLHRKYQVSWEIFGRQITIQLAGQVGEDEYMAFGLSGSNDKSQMEGADVTIAYMDGQRGFATDYDITANAPCNKTIGRYKGVCRDELVGGFDNNQMFMATRKDGINFITYRRSLNSSDRGDKEYPTNRPVYVVWALGRLDENKQPNFNNASQIFKSDVKLELNRKEPENTCVYFTENNKRLRETWEKSEILNKSIITSGATISDLREEKEGTKE